MEKKQYLLIVLLVMFLWLIPCGAWAYSKDIHFSLTYVLCRLAGIEVNDSLWIAAADQSMDNNESTTAFPGVLGAVNQQLNPFKKKTYADNGRFWHDFSDLKSEAARIAISERLGKLWIAVSKDRQSSADDDARIRADIALGQFLHAKQDYYSHRHLTKDAEDDNSYTPYGSQLGHAADGHEPDEVRRRLPLAKKMAKASYEDICKYAISAFGKSPNQSLDLAPLIDAVASSYEVVVTHYGKGGAPPTIDYPIPESSEVVNDKLRPCLKASFASAWPGPEKLPIYKEPSCDLTLPYDKPETPLSDVVQRFQSATEALATSP